MSAQAHAWQKLLEVRIRHAVLRAHAGAAKHPRGQCNQVGNRRPAGATKPEQPSANQTGAARRGRPASTTTSAPAGQRRAIASNAASSH